MTFTLKFLSEGDTCTTEFVDFDPFSLTTNEMGKLLHMMHKTMEALSTMYDYFDLLEEVNDNVIKIKG